MEWDYMGLYGTYATKTLASIQVTQKLNSYQQNSNLQGGVQVICMQPWFFSIGRLHLGQGFEFAKILSKIEGQYEFDTPNNFTCV